MAYDTTWARTPVARAVRAALLEAVGRPVSSLVASPDVRGLDRLGELEAPAIFVANHSSHLDTLLVLSVLPPRFRHASIVAAGADYFFDRGWKAVVSAGLLGAIPMERQRVNRQSSEMAADRLAEGWNLIIFPEGGRSPDGWAQPFRAGAAHLWIQSGVPVVPIHISGTRAILPKGTVRLRRAPTVVTFGAPVHARAGEDARRFAVRVEQAVAQLADESATDWWSARLRASADSTPPLRGPEGSGWRRSWALPANYGRSRSDSNRWPGV